MKVQLLIGNNRTLDLELDQALDVARHYLNYGKEQDARHIAKGIVSGLALYRVSLLRRGERPPPLPKMPKPLCKLSLLAFEEAASDMTL